MSVPKDVHFHVRGIQRPPCARTAVVRHVLENGRGVFMCTDPEIVVHTIADLWPSPVVVMIYCFVFVCGLLALV